MLVAAATLLLIVAGALVTSNEAGLSVPDWPLSYGQWMPRMSGGVLFEHGHRMVATAVGLLTIILAVWLWRTDERRWLKRLGFAALTAVIVQGLLGGITVIYLLPWPVSVGHASLAQLFFTTTVAIALFTGPGWLRKAERQSDTRPFPLPWLALTTFGAIFAQLVLGATLRHRVIGPVPHILWALVVTAMVFWLTRDIFVRRREPALRKAAGTLAGLVALQLALGTGAYLARLATADAPQPMPLMVWSTVAHVAVGAVVLATAGVLTLHAFRLTEWRGAAETSEAIG